MKTAFFGTPPIAVAALQALSETTEVVGVVCQPDRPAGRGLKLRPCAVKQAAQELSLSVHQPRKVKTGNLHEWLAERRVEAAIVLAYGRILPPAVLSAPRFGCINLHASLLPKYRGAAPINWAIVHGETKSGISLMQMDEGLDTGPVFLRRELEITESMTAGELAHATAELAAKVVTDDLPRVWGGHQAKPQDHTAATHAPPIERHHCEINWTHSAEAIRNLVRGMAPRPSAFTWHGKKRLKLLKTGLSDLDAPPDSPPGTVLVAERDLILVQTGDRPLRVIEAQLEGRKTLGAAELVNGRTIRASDVLGSPPGAA